ncbi:Holo-(acyl-carrier-protein) synthase [Hyella patelloides LEGE 07179]|uniref:Holo-[acyl-carrier-protein] synthase n=1 Tax=Hyella patelloides LEGE 07179 TaxID=945734 RepID=A0A563W1L4_9CYAN|nr:holo-ACP synthase [Hyella patelloides]VEP17560.1 Holo-(acyl-carrier-protein) synthase [Hyella patelloides LEGE 07179]
MIIDIQRQIYQSLSKSQAQNLGVVGQGIYLVEIDKFQMLRNILGESFEQRCFTEGERGHSFSGTRRLQFFAGRWAAKEAVVKAMERSRIPENSWLEIEIPKKATGEPSVLLTGEVKTIAQQLGIKRWLLSISHTSSYAVASAIALSS